MSYSQGVGIIISYNFILIPCSYISVNDSSINFSPPNHFNSVIIWFRGFHNCPVIVRSNFIFVRVFQDRYFFPVYCDIISSYNLRHRGGDNTPHHYTNKQPHNCSRFTDFSFWNDITIPNSCHRDKTPPKTCGDSWKERTWKFFVAFVINSPHYDSH